MFKRFEDSVFGTGKISAMISSRSILLYTIIATGPPTGRDATVMKSTSGNRSSSNNRYGLEASVWPEAAAKDLIHRPRPE